MQFRKFGSKYFIRLDKGEEIISQLKILCEAEGIRLAELRGLGATDDFTVSVFSVQEGRYIATRHQDYSEITSLWGTITTKDGEFYPHIHMSAGSADGNKVVGGHLNSAVISATCELVLEVSEGVIERKYNDAVKLNLFEFVD